MKNIGMYSIFNFAIRIFGAGCGYFCLILITNGTSISVLNNYTLTSSALSILYIIANFGFENDILYFLTKIHSVQFLKFIRKAIFLTITGSFVIGVLLLIFMPWDAQISDITIGYVLFLCTIAFQALLMVNRCIQQVEKCYIAAPLAENFFRPVLFIIMLLFGIHYFQKLSYIYLGVSLALSFLFALIISYSLLTPINNRFAPDPINKHQKVSIIKSSKDFFIIQLFNQLPNFLGVYFIGWWVTDKSAVASFRIAFQTASIISFGLRSVESVFVARLSEAYHQNKDQKVANIYSFMRKLTLISGTVLCGGAIIVSPLLNIIYDNRLSNVVLYFSLLSMQQFFNSALGSADYLMMMTGHSRYVRWISVLQTFLFVLLSVWLIPLFHAVGAGIALIFATIFYKSSLSILSNKINGFSLNNREYSILFSIGIIIVAILVIVVTRTFD